MEGPSRVLGREKEMLAVMPGRAKTRRLFGQQVSLYTRRDLPNTLSVLCNYTVSLNYSKDLLNPPSEPIWERDVEESSHENFGALPFLIPYLPLAGAD